VSKIKCHVFVVHEDSTTNLYSLHALQMHHMQEKPTRFTCL